MNIKINNYHKQGMVPGRNESQQMKYQAMFCRIYQGRSIQNLFYILERIKQVFPKKS
jgi:hypothetical protein